MADTLTPEQIAEKYTLGSMTPEGDGWAWEFTPDVNAVCALREMQEQTRREDAEIAAHWADNYPVDVFVAPTAKRAKADFDAGFVPDVYSAESARNSARCIAAQILALLEPKSEERKG